MYILKIIRTFPVTNFAISADLEPMTPRSRRVLEFSTDQLGIYKKCPGWDFQKCRSESFPSKNETRFLRSKKRKAKPTRGDVHDN